MGRTMLTLTDAQKAEVETLAAVLTAEQVADYFGIGRRTFYSMMERDEEIAARYKKGKAKAIGVIAQGLINKARGGDTTSMIFFLKTQAGWRETVTVEQLAEPEPRALDLSGLSDNSLRELATVMWVSYTADGSMTGSLPAFISAVMSSCCGHFQRTARPHLRPIGSNIAQNLSKS